MIGLDRSTCAARLRKSMRTLGLVSLGAATAVCLVSQSGHPADADLARAAGPADWHRLPGRGRDRPPWRATSARRDSTTAAAIWLAAILGAAAGAATTRSGARHLCWAWRCYGLGGRLEMRLHRVLDPINEDKHRHGNGGDARKSHRRR
ncbi:hypothetical protein ACTMU2_01955 [Cupriavidus basilensis]